MSRKQIGGDFYHLYLHWPREPMVKTIPSSSPNPSASISFAQNIAQPTKQIKNLPSNIHTVVLLFASQILHSAKRPLPPKSQNPSSIPPVPELNLTSPSQPALHPRHHQPQTQTYLAIVTKPIHPITIRSICHSTDNSKSSFAHTPHPYSIPHILPILPTAPLRPGVALYAKAEQKTVRACVHCMGMYKKVKWEKQIVRYPDPHNRDLTGVF